MSLFENNQQLEEFFLIMYDRLSLVNKRWWYTLVLTVLLVLPIYLVLSQTFFIILFDNYKGPEIIYQPIKVEPLEIIEKKVFKLQSNSYSGFVRIKNLNLDRGVSEQAYTTEFKSIGGTVINKVSGKTFILPGSEKILVFNRFTTDNEPSELSFTLEKSHFIAKPSFPIISLEVQRVEFKGKEGEFVVSALIRNSSAFTLKGVNLPVILYNNSNQVLGVNSTTVNDVKSLESRSFQYFWPNKILGVVRAEIVPEINIFEKGILISEPPKSPLDPFDQSLDNKRF